MATPCITLQVPGSLAFRHGISRGRHCQDCAPGSLDGEMAGTSSLPPTQGRRHVVSGCTRKWKMITSDRSVQKTRRRTPQSIFMHREETSSAMAFSRGYLSQIRQPRLCGSYRKRAVHVKASGDGEDKLEEQKEKTDMQNGSAVRARPAGAAIRELPLDRIRRPLGRTRANDPAKVEALMASIAEIGLQEPIDVLEVDGVYYGFSGCHRFEAHQRLGLPSIKCRVRRGTQATLKMHMR